jgi:hypothetical protein
MKFRHKIKLGLAMKTQNTQLPKSMKKSSEKRYSTGQSLYTLTGYTAELENQEIASSHENEEKSTDSNRK